ncbi:MAG: tetratricopeptide repeat protein, partial [Anaerolineales bacterium]|nr:tetratricopeptide repeat protein [Anaerolineales bacterium]
LFQQITNVMQNLAAKHPMLLVLDDLQWVDSASTSLLFHIGRRLQGSRILIIGAYRPVDIALGRKKIRHPLETVLAEFKRIYGDVWVNLGRVEKDDGRRFVGLLLDTEPNLLDARFRNTLFKHTGGHPLFTIELLRTLQERMDLIKDQEGYWITTPELDWKTLPARIEGVIEERIGRLDDDLREILTAASVEGEEFTLQVIAEVKGGDERQLLNSLSRELDKKHHLIKEECIQRVEDKRLHTFRFRHNLFQQYLYGELGEIKREWLHGEIAATLEILYGGEAHQIAPQLALHFKLAGNPEKAQRYLVEAGRQARDRYANQEAIEYYTQALELVRKEDLDSRYKLLLKREKVHTLMGNRQERATDLDSLELLIEALGDVEKQAEVTLRRAKFAGSTGDYPDAIAAAKQSMNLARETGNTELAASAQTEWGRALAFMGELDEARLHSLKALELARNAQTTTSAQPSWLKIEAGSLNNLGYISNIQGDHSGSSAYLEQALEINRQIRDRRGEGVMLQNLGVVSYDQGDFVKSERYWGKALRIFQEIGDRQHEAMVMNSLGNISSDLLGDYIEAQRRYVQALTIAQEVGDRLNEGMALANIGIVAINQQDFIKAKSYTQQALEIYIEIDLNPEMSSIYLFLGNSLTGLRQMDEAVKAYTEAIHYAEELDQYDAIFEAQAGLARIAQVKGELAQAITQVDAILTQMADNQIQSQLESEATMRIYLICYQILQANVDPRAGKVLE